MATPVLDPTSTADRLSAAGERVTRQRLLVADALASAARQVSAQDLYDRLRRVEPRIGRATVFRTLEALVAAGVARRLEQDGHVYGYVACRPEHHHHLACDNCGRFLCSLCDVDIGAGHQCPACLESGKRKRKEITVESRH